MAGNEAIVRAPRARVMMALWGVRNSMRNSLRAHLPPRPLNTLVHARVPDAFGAEAYLIATKAGLYTLAHGRLTRLMSGQYYGLTRRGDDWYAFEHLGAAGRILRFQLEDARMVHPEVVLGGLSPGCHQIDLIDSQLLIVDTYNNRLLACRLEVDGLQVTAEHHPVGKLVDGRASANYVHMNSLWAEGDARYLLLHNETVRTGRHSEIAKLAPDFSIFERIETPARSAHNLARFQGRFLYCDSLGGALMHGDRRVHGCDLFTRGLSITPACIALGGSDYGRREQREFFGGAITLLDHEFHELARLRLPGMVQEIRSCAGPDAAMSGGGMTSQLERSEGAACGPR